MPKREDRWEDVSPQRTPDSRGSFRHDRDRILYSPAFRRLGGITQVISPSEGQPTHSRLTHTLEVAQIARSIAERLLQDESDETQHLIQLGGGLDADVVEAASLAHDLGHPPFGHLTEHVLDELVTSYGVPAGFEGNAQSFRILTRLAINSDAYDGLGLTRATLSAVSKYPWLRGEREDKPDKWGAYEIDEPVLEWSREHLDEGLKRPRNGSGETYPHRKDLRTIEAQIMDWADDVAYAIHDLDDFYRLGTLPSELTRNGSEEMSRFLLFHFEREGIHGQKERDAAGVGIENLLASSPFTNPYTGSFNNEGRLKIFTSLIVGDCIEGVRLVEVPGEHVKLDIPKQTQQIVTIFKNMTHHYIINGRALASQRIGQERLIRRLFDSLCLVGSSKWKRGVSQPNNAFEDILRIIPRFNADMIRKSKLDDATIIRAVADVISGMTEQQAVSLYSRFSGERLGSAVDPILF